MPELAPNPELLHSLGRLVRGLSALFWGLPLALIVCSGTALAGWLRTLEVVPPGTALAGWLRTLEVLPPLLVTGLLLFGLLQLGSFQKQERPWRSALDRARLVALINFGLSPFLFWWHSVPDNLFFGSMVAALVLSALLFLFTLNQVVLRLGAMLPDEVLRNDTRQYTRFNQSLLIALVLLTAVYIALARIPGLPLELMMILGWLHVSGVWLLILFLLLPLAMTMALIWKTKEVILESVFGATA